MDHANAHVMEYTDVITTQNIVSDATHEERMKTLQKGETMMQHKEQQQHAAYYKILAAIIQTQEDVLLFGPTNAKAELLNIVRADSHFDDIRIEVLPADKMTPNQEEAFVKDYFSNR